MDAGYSTRMISKQIIKRKRTMPRIENKTHSSSIQSPTLDHHILMYQAQPLSQDIQRLEIQGDHQTLLEIQRYADFQAGLSKTSYDDLDRNGTFSFHKPRILLEKDLFKEDPPKQKYKDTNPTSRKANPLQSPVVIPMRDAEIHGSRLSRAYAPALEKCGINQNTFLHFIDSFNASISVSFLPLVVNADLDL